MCLLRGGRLHASPTVLLCTASWPLMLVLSRCKRRWRLQRYSRSNQQFSRDSGTARVMCWPWGGCPMVLSAVFSQLQFVFARCKGKLLEHRQMYRR